MAVYEATERRGGAPCPRAQDVGRECFSYLENMYIDYGGGADAIESIVGYRRMLRLDSVIHSFAPVTGRGETLIIHSKDNLYLATKKEGESNLSLRRIASLEDTDSYVIPLGEICLITDGKRMLRVDGSGRVDTISRKKDIVGCRCGVIYDGRLVLSQNPDFPRRVFISEGVDADGEVGFCHYDELCPMKSIISLVAMDGYLLTLASSDSEGEIIYRKSGGKDSPCDYTVEKITDKLPPFIKAREFNRRLMLIASEGLVSINPFYEDTRPVIRSIGISTMLTSEEVEPELTEWMGYLVLTFGESMYLADERGGDGWDWYFIYGVGGYADDRRVFRYLDSAPQGCLVHPSIGQVAEGEVYSCGSREGMIYYSKEDNKCYAVYPTAEMCGGKLLPPRQIMGCGSLMWFCTEEGIYLFNNDRRGMTPNDIPFAENMPDWDIPLAKEKIHPLYYSFAGHTPIYTAITHEKNSAGGRVIIEVKELSGEDITVTDLTGGNPSRRRTISTRRRANMTKSDENDVKSSTRTATFTTVSLSECGGRGGRDGLCISTNQFASPFGIRSVSYEQRK